MNPSDIMSDEEASRLNRSVVDRVEAELRRMIGGRPLNDDQKLIILVSTMVSIAVTLAIVCKAKDVP